MKLLNSIFILLTFNIANAATDCAEPKGVYTPKDMVLNQFVFKSGNPNWGDWCQEVSNTAENKLCNEELNQWDNWLTCTETSYKKSCEKWADKENFAATEEEYNEFISTCIKNNYSRLSTNTKSNISIKEKCRVISKFKELTTGLNKEVICNETARALTNTSTLEANSYLQIHISGRSTYALRLNKILLKDGQDSVYNGSGILKWNPNGEKVLLD